MVTLQSIETYYYRPQTKLGEGNVFTCVCDSVHGGVPVRGGCLVETPPRTATAAGMHSCCIGWRPHFQGQRILGH